jgi:transcription elongation GreA/GreB family factor
MQYKNYITQNGYEALKEELHNLVTKERPLTTATITWAAGKQRACRETRPKAKRTLLYHLHSQERHALDG